MMKQRRVQTNSKRKMTNGKIVNIELDIKCSCSPATSSNNDASIQFTRRYLQCYSLMPVRMLRLLIERILPHSPMMKVSIFDCHDRLLKDYDRLYTLKHSSSSSNHIPLRFTLINTITSLPHCSCLSPPIDDDDHHRSSIPMTIQHETIEQILSTCAITQGTVPFSPCSWSLDETIVDAITSEFGEICPDYPLDLSMKSKSHSFLSDTFCDTISFC